MNIYFYIHYFKINNTFSFYILITHNFGKFISKGTFPMEDDIYVSKKFLMGEDILASIYYIFMHKIDGRGGV